jgi:hypothetical protein
MKTPRILLFLTLLLATSCAAPIVLVGVGAAVGIWTHDDFTDDRGQIVVNASAQDVFLVAKGAIEARPDAKDITVTRGTMRIQFLEDKADVIVQVMLMPDTPQFSTLKVYASELGIRGRADLAQQIAEDINARF